MTVASSQSRPELALPAETVSAFGRRVYSAVRAEVPAYGAIGDPGFDRDFSEVNRRNVETFFRALAEDRVPTDAELAPFQVAARRRLHQAVPLEAIFHSYRVGVRVMWECLLEVAPRQDHGRLAVLALEYADRVSRAAAEAYVEERQRSAQSRQDLVRLMLTRVINGLVDETDLAEAASVLEVDLREPHVVMLLAASTATGARSSAEVDSVLADVRQELTAAEHGVLAALLSAGVVAILRADLVEHGIDIVRAAVARSESGESLLRLGVGTARTGGAGMAASYREAVRAQALGALAEPERSVHRYQDVRVFDLFTEGDAVAAYVREVLGGLVQLPERDRVRLVETLEALFTCALNRKQAAYRLGVHQNTLSLRLQRLEEILGGRFTSGDFCFRVELACRLARIAPGALSASDT